MSNTRCYTYPPRVRGSSQGPREASPNSGTPGSAAGGSTPVGSATDRSQKQPIRVTEDGVESLLYCLVHTIEFHRSLGFKNAPAAPGTATIAPVSITSPILGGITYLTCSENSHNKSISANLPEAVRKAKSIPLAGMGEQSPPGAGRESSPVGATSAERRDGSLPPVANVSFTANTTSKYGIEGVLFKLRVRISKVLVKKQPSIFGSFLAPTTTKVPIEEWEFRLIKTSSLFSTSTSQNFNALAAAHVAAAAAAGQLTNPSSSSSSSGGVRDRGSSVPNTSAVSAAMMSDGSSQPPSSSFPLGSPSNQVGSPNPPATPSGGLGGVVLANDPMQIRDVLLFVADKAFEAVDTYVCDEFRSGSDLHYDVDIIRA